MLKRKNSERKTALKNTTDKFELPTSTLGKGAHIELFSNKSALIDGCAGVIEYTTEYVKLNIGKGTVSISGLDLQIVFFDAEQLSLSGKISNIEFCV